MLLNRSLSLQVFAVITLLTLFTFCLLGLILLPEIDQKIRTMEQQRSDEKFSQAQLMLEFGNQFSVELDQFVVDNHITELNRFLSPAVTYAQEKAKQVALKHITKDQAIEQIKHYVIKLNQELKPYYKDEDDQARDKHYWLAYDNGQWLYHPQGEPTNLSKHHEASFQTFISDVKHKGQQIQPLPWLGSHMLDTKPVNGMHIKALDLVVGIDFDVAQLPRSPLPAYRALRETLQKILTTASFGENGQVFFFFSDLDYLSSKRKNNFYQTLMESKNPYTGNRYVEDFQYAAHAQQPIDVLWDHKNDPQVYQYPAFARAFYYPQREIYLVSISYPEDMDKQPDAIQRYILMVMLICLLLALCAAWWLSKRIVSPIKKLSDYAQVVGERNHGIEPPAIALDRQDEVGTLAIELNRMVHRLESTISGLDQTVAQRTKELEVKNHNLHVSLQDKDALLKEVHHRVKNNLAVIISFIQLQERRISDTHMLSVLQSLRSRIFTIELIHNQLYRSDNFSQLNPSHYYADLLRETWALHNPQQGIKYELQVDLAQQEVEQLLTCGQILNELMSNSLKYAFSSELDEIQSKTNDIQGLVTFKIHEMNGEIHFYYADNGKGFSGDNAQAVSGDSLPSSLDLSTSDSGLGLILLTHLVKGKLKGQLHWDNSKQGLSWLITFPVR